VSSVGWNPAGTRIVSASYKTLRIWESRLEDALPMWRASPRRREIARRRQKVRPRVNALFDEHIFLEPVLAALEGDPSLPGDMREVALRLAKARGDPGPSYLNGRAWPLVDPDRSRKDTDVELGLRLARKAVRLAPEDSAIRDTLAWGLFANGHFDEAVRESQRALDLAPEGSKDLFRGQLERLRRRTAETLAASSPVADEGAGRR